MEALITIVYLLLFIVLVVVPFIMLVNTDGKDKTKTDDKGSFYEISHRKDKQKE